MSGLYFAHPESRYFAVGKLGRDQVLDYHLRKGMALQEVERWLGPWLNYEPQAMGHGFKYSLRLRLWHWTSGAEKTLDGQLISTL